LKVDEVSLLNFLVCTFVRQAGQSGSHLLEADWLVEVILG